MTRALPMRQQARKQSPEAASLEQTYQTLATAASKLGAIREALVGMDNSLGRNFPSPLRQTFGLISKAEMMLQVRMRAVNAELQERDASGRRGPYQMRRWHQ